MHPIRFCKKVIADQTNQREGNVRRNSVKRDTHAGGNLAERPAIQAALRAERLI